MNICCIGLHKTGTSTLHQIAFDNKLKSTHSTDWYNNENKIKLYDFFVMVEVIIII
jgi:hypothetical protein